MQGGVVSLVSVDLIRECIMQGCDSHSEYREDCETCGFFRKEAERRKQIPFCEYEDGTRGKIIRRKNNGD